MSKIQRLIEAVSKAETYAQRAILNIEEFGIVDKKQKFKYISWTYADIILRTLDEDATWEAFETPYPNQFLGIKLTFKGKEFRHWMPILNAMNHGTVIKPEDGSLVFYNPFDKTGSGGIGKMASSMDLNNTQMRGFAKLVSIATGVGIGIYAGEDLSQYDNKEVFNKSNVEEINKLKELATSNKEEVIRIITPMIKERPAIANGSGILDYINNLYDDEVKQILGELNNG